MREIVVSDQFVAAFDRLSGDLHQRAQRAIGQLAHNPAHPSLKAHKIYRTPGKWECYVSDSHRIIFEPAKDGLRLWAIGDHAVIDRVHHQPFAAHTPFRRLNSAAPRDSRNSFMRPMEWQEPKTDESAEFPLLSCQPRISASWACRRTW